MAYSNLLPPLDEILEARELRWNKRREYSRLHTTLSMTLRLPHALRLSYPDIPKKVLPSLEGLGFSLKESRLSLDGPEYIFVSDERAPEAKRKVVDFEENHRLGGLLDLDVSDVSGAVSRSDLGLDRRKCLICGSDAWACISLKRYTLREIRSKIESLLCLESSFITLSTEDSVASVISDLAGRAAEEELRLLFKPGLISPISQGSHSDMDFDLMQGSLCVLKNYWRQCASSGFKVKKEAFEALLPELRTFGLGAEAKMYRQTCGVNTYKGLIYLLGILCASVSFVLKHQEPLEQVFERVHRLCANELLRNVGSISKAHERGCFLLGARGETSLGFPTVRKALNFYESELEKNEEYGNAELNTLLLLMSLTNDSNIAGRSGEDGLERIKNRASQVLSKGGLSSKEGTKDFKCLAEEVAQRRVSPGGSADLFICVNFLHRIKKILRNRNNE